MSVSDPVHWPHVGIKFNTDGFVRRHPGNTIGCHERCDSRLGQALRVARDGLARTEAARGLAFLPPQTYHMTVFEGAADHARVAALWPADAPLDRCTQHLDQELAGFDMCCEMPLHMRVADRRRQSSRGVLVLAPLDGDENRKLRFLRDRLSGLFMIRARIHERYEFQITLAYPVEGMAPACHVAFLATQACELAAVARKVPVIEKGMSGFCTSGNMNAFCARPELLWRRVPRASTLTQGVRA
ncbi:DUF1868 domain-containing protein [Paraburkholderia caledonica]|uniref:DUF1868 domain-containing protein n=1 Tax=Paraburkholderia caledonica TaxID=134536 RepID=UPI0037094227